MQCQSAIRLQQFQTVDYGILSWDIAFYLSLPQTHTDFSRNSLPWTIMTFPIGGSALGAPHHQDTKVLKIVRSELYSVVSHRLKIKLPGSFQKLAGLEKGES